MWNHRQSLPTTIPLESVLAQQPEPSLRPKDLSIIHQTTNTSDARCVSWILRNIADPEALDAAVQLAGVIRWFDDGINVGLPCDLSFRCLGLQRLCISPRLNHTKNYRELVDIVFGSPESEAIAVLLLAWTTTGYSFHPQALLGICTAHLVDPPPPRVPFSPRLRSLLMRSVEFIIYKGFEGVGWRDLPNCQAISVSQPRIWIVRATGKGSP